MLTDGNGGAKFCDVVRSGGDSEGSAESTGECLWTINSPQRPNEDHWENRPGCYST